MGVINYIFTTINEHFQKSLTYISIRENIKDLMALNKNEFDATDFNLVFEN